MIYKFKSKAAADLIMLGPQGDELLRLLGRELPCPKGIVEPEQMSAAIARLEAAIAEQEALLRTVQSANEGASNPDPETAEEAAGAARGLPLRTRLWPMIQMLERARAAGEPVVWGV